MLIPRLDVTKMDKESSQRKIRKRKKAISLSSITEDSRVPVWPASNTT
jgi:hypothetical protein